MNKEKEQKDTWRLEVLFFQNFECQKKDVQKNFKVYHHSSSRPCGTNALLFSVLPGNRKSAFSKIFSLFLFRHDNLSSQEA